MVSVVCASCRIYFILVLFVVMPSVIMLNVVMLSVMAPWYTVELQSGQVLD